jgi:hypothetical protein
MDPFPDIVGAFIEHTKTLTAVVAMIGGSASTARVSGTLRIKTNPDDLRGWEMPTTAIVYTSVPGPSPMGLGTMPVSASPIQYECYGTNRLSAGQLGRMLLGNLFPDPPATHGFIAAHCAVIGIQPMGGMAVIQETVTDFPRAVGTLLVSYVLRPTP